MSMLSSQSFYQVVSQMFGVVYVTRLQSKDAVQNVKESKKCLQTRTFPLVLCFYSFLGTFYEMFFVVIDITDYVLSCTNRAITRSGWRKYHWFSLCLKSRSIRNLWRPWGLSNFWLFCHIPPSYLGLLRPKAQRLALFRPRDSAAIWIQQ